MSLKPHDLLKFAQELQKECTKFGNEEVALRTAVGRAYYSVYHVAFDAAAALKVDLNPASSKNVGVHERLFSALELHAHNSLNRNFGRALNNAVNWARGLREERRLADYSLNRDVNSQWCLTVIDKAERTLRKFEIAFGLMGDKVAGRSEIQTATVEDSMK